jgi:hypothetical protein
MAGSVRDWGEPEKRWHVYSLVVERRRNDPRDTAACTIADIVAAAYPDPDLYWYLFVELGLERVELSVERFIASHTSASHLRPSTLEAALRDDPIAQGLLHRPHDAPRRDRLRAFLNDPDYVRFAPDLRDYLNRAVVPAAESSTVADARQDTLQLEDPPQHALVLDDTTVVNEILGLMDSGVSQAEAIDRTYLKAPRARKDTTDKSVKDRLRGKVQQALIRKQV